MKRIIRGPSNWNLQSDGGSYPNLSPMPGYNNAYLPPIQMPGYRRFGDGIVPSMQHPGPNHIGFLPHPQRWRNALVGNTLAPIYGFLAPTPYIF